MNDKVVVLSRELEYLLIKCDIISFYCFVVCGRMMMIIIITMMMMICFLWVQEH